MSEEQKESLYEEANEMLLNDEFENAIKVRTNWMIILLFIYVLKIDLCVWIAFQSSNWIKQ